MCEILLSIHPEYVNKIFSGEKAYEFRKVTPKKEPDKIIIYCTAPISAIVGEAEIETVIKSTPQELWKQTNKKGGVKDEFFFAYYKGKDVAIAYKLKNIVAYEETKPLSAYGVKSAPQSFVYL